MRPDRFGELRTADLAGLAPCRENRRDDRRIGGAQFFGEPVEILRQPRVAVRLENDPQMSPRIPFAQERDRRRDLGRVVRVVFDNGQIFRVVPHGHAPLDAGEIRERGERRFAVLSGENGDVSVKCFRRHTLPKRVLVEKRVVGRKEFYADFEGSYYLEQPPYNWGWNGDAWLLPKMPFLIMRLGEPRDFLYRNPLMYVIPGVGQLILVCDAVMFVGGGCVDLCLLIGKSLCSGCTIAGAWVGGRCFGWTGDWELRKHKPGALRMASYMPFVNLFCTFQTPPYMPMKYRFAHMYAEEVKLAPADQPVLSRKLLTTLTPEQIAFGSCKLTARVLCDGKVCGEREYVTDGDGNADLTELLRGGAATASSASGKLVLELHLCDRSGAPVLERRVELAAEQVLPRAAAREPEAIVSL